MGTFFELGKDKAAKGEGWAPPFISCAQDTVGLYPPLPLRLSGYGTPLPLPCQIDYIYTSGRTYVMTTYVSKENDLGPDAKLRYIWGFKGPIFIL